MAASVVDYLSQIQKLTNTNLQILKTLNDSFYTKKNHLFTEIDDTTYVIPSFLSLENKINALQENFENLIKSPETCEAYFNFDGNTRAIEVRKYSHTPNSIKLSPIESFGVESNSIFKDFMTPIPYVNLEIPQIPNDIVKVNVKKIVAMNGNLQSLFKTKLKYTETIINSKGEEEIVTKWKVSENTAYGDLYKTLLDYKKGVDYVEYDTVYDLPIHKNLGTATYVIESVVGDTIDNNLDEYITLKLRNNIKDSTYSNKLTYKSFNDTIEIPLKKGDELINFDGTGKVVVTEIRTSTNTIVVKVVNGEYLNFIGTDSYDSNNDNDIHDLSKLRFHSAVNFDNDKCIKVPLEENQYVFVAVAPLNSRMNIQSGWGTGLVIDTYSLKNGDTEFKTYYDKNVKNIGDILFEMTSMVSSPVSGLSQLEFNEIISKKPVFTNNDVQVLQINTHLDNSKTVKRIRDAYTQKKEAESELDEVQGKIDETTKMISNISFDDTPGLKQVYTSQLSQLNYRKTELNTVIESSQDSIYMNSTSSETPINNAKYRIRGFYVPRDLGTIRDKELKDHVVGLEVQYRYKNTTMEVGSAVSMSDGNETYIYSDWNIMSGFNKRKVAKCENGVYTYEYEQSNENVNEPSYNQIDIPISKGESVDIRVRVVYDFGQPYVTITSKWSDIVNVEFPSEFILDNSIYSIINENNNSLESSRVIKLLKSEGVDDHIKDSMTDQDIVYYHKPESIASGFYTAERRIIPLKDKLKSLSDEISLLRSEIIGTNGNLSISVLSSSTITNINPDQTNIIQLTAYNDLVQKVPTDVLTGQYYNIGDYDIYKESDNKYVVSTFLNLKLSNTSSEVVKLYSVMPGSRDVIINDLKTGIDKSGYIFEYDIEGKKGGVHYDWQGRQDGEITLQKCNQYVTFRVKDIYTGDVYYDKNYGDKLPTLDTKSSMIVYPFLSSKYGLSLDSDEIRTYKVINPNTELIIPIKCNFYFTAETGSEQELVKYLSFDIRTSLYKDPMNYLIKFIVKRDSTVDDIANQTNKQSLWEKLVNPIKYNVFG